MTVPQNHEAATSPAQTVDARESALNAVDCFFTERRAELGCLSPEGDELHTMVRAAPAARQPQAQQGVAEGAGDVDALSIATEALEEIALAGMSGTGQESDEAMTEWHARQAWKFIGIAARAKSAIAALATKEQRS
jgi:hypothetical protein